MDELSIPTLGMILLTASLVAMISRRLRLPYSVGLVAAGIALSFLPGGVELPLSRDLIFTVFLPPLIFQAALEIEWRHFRINLPVTTLLAFPGVAVAAAAVAAGMHLLLGWSWIGASLFGVLIAATDPVSVLAAFKEMKVQPRLGLLVESESLLNDGAAAVGFAILVAIAAGGSATPLAIGYSFAWTVAGGVAVGAAVAGVLLFIAGRTEDHLVEITLTTIAAYGSFLIAEKFGMSGVLATLTAGLLVGNVGWQGAISTNARSHVLAFWGYAAFLANSIVFILIGGHEAHQPLGLFAGTSAIAVVLVLLGRVLAIYPLCVLLNGTSLKVDLKYQHILVWGGLRGSLALALALALPQTIAERGVIIVTAFAVVAFSVFIQGLTMPWLIRRMGLIAGQAHQFGTKSARQNR
ncbi:MAG: sodium:proton antiporter [Mesorhizobium sp.]|uniref:cation:proton antiporter n=1 Tax=unclassified Mesorhizobium TaxID=325217 RepID=UPI000F75C0E0|nr:MULTISPECIES: cation:proton antiporter [unclassified Mesorhizobium]RVC70912.1 sodium:proton antiporter [Mesorhizobium sp. M00.F.Ca.ET.038.03.1.1]RVC81921.1 sodium:proton antiporter [Mesorhizobium sp. M2A.F.Ca.ET.046.02.1.1]AZO36461.1 sodium:proton antiporter [Mesorhizobium sp. M2A.F.Ca.ET.046.03.2.1]RWB45035.1 MAG: sodium:proton antiporter [Mesorhizobium sp.]RWE20845.1 MAG: sodium:proton antiporter [Mesorhizobium sp.]